MKVGDRVRVAESVDRDAYDDRGPGWADSIKDYLGSEGTIVEVFHSPFNPHEVLDIEVEFYNEAKWAWLPDDLIVEEDSNE